NSGVVFLPAQEASACARYWLAEVNALLGDPRLSERRNSIGQRELGFCDQIALTILHYQGLLPPFRQLGNQMNFPAHLIPIRKSDLPYVVHYHSENVWRRLIEEFPHWGAL